VPRHDLRHSNDRGLSHHYYESITHKLTIPAVALFDEIDLLRYTEKISRRFSSTREAI